MPFTTNKNKYDRKKNFKNQLPASGGLWKADFKPSYKF